jgi:uncharacterized protein
MTQSPDAPLETPPGQPVAEGERIITLDFVRGVAVLGILFPNIVAYAYPMLAYYWPDGLSGGATATDRWVWLAQLVLVDGKFRGLFTLLFGAGMALFMERAAARGQGVWLQARRLLWLGLFGLAHFLLLWTGDILLLYAASGLAALTMIGWDARTQVQIGVLWAVCGALFYTLTLGGAAMLEVSPAMQAMQSEAWSQIEWAAEYSVLAAREETEVMRGGYTAIVAWRAAMEAPAIPGDTLFVALVETIPLMLVGMGLYRLGFFSGGFDAARMRGWGWIGYVGGALLTLPLGVWVMREEFPLFLTQFVFNGASALFHLPMALGLAALLVLWAPGASGTWLGSRFVAAGRMAFSNYVGTSLVMMFVFQGWAGGLYGTPHRIELSGFVLLAWALMLAWSKPWLDRFRYGPLEWLWRCLTYGRIFAFSRQKSA